MGRGASDSPSGYQIAVGKDEKVLENDGADGLYNNVNVLNATGLQT